MLKKKAHILFLWIFTRDLKLFKEVFNWYTITATAPSNSALMILSAKKQLSLCLTMAIRETLLWETRNGDFGVKFGAGASPQDSPKSYKIPFKKKCQLVLDIVFLLTTFKPS